MDWKISGALEASPRIPSLSGANRDGDAARPDRDQVDPVHRNMLQRLWERKVDDVIALSKACQQLSADGDRGVADGAARPLGRLRQRTARAYEQLAEIVDAIARVDNGTYGMCVYCHRPLRDEWLADEPQLRYCPDCTLRLSSTA